MIKLKELLTEESYESTIKVNDVEYEELQKKDGTWEDGALLSIDYTFETPANKELGTSAEKYKVTFYSGDYNAEDKTFAVSFGLYKDQGYKLDTFELTGKGKVYSIVHTICKVIEKFVQEFKDEVEKIVIEGTSESRTRVYKALIPKYLDSAILPMVTIK